jgi:hypothetical protein
MRRVAPILPSVLVLVFSAAAWSQDAGTKDDPFQELIRRLNARPAGVEPKEPQPEAPPPPVVAPPADDRDAAVRKILEDQSRLEPQPPPPVVQPQLEQLATPAGHFKAEEGLYIGAFFAAVNVGGDFDGKSEFFEPSESIVIPDLDDGLGFGVAFGVRQKTMAFELSYQRSWHDWTSASMVLPEGDAAVNSFNMDARIFLLSEGRFQPHILAGLCIPWIDVEDGGIAGGSHREDVTYLGFGGNVGLGLNAYLWPNLALNITGGYRAAGYFFSFADKNEALDEPLFGGGWFAMVGTMLTF